MYFCRSLTTDEIVFVYNTYMRSDFPKDELKPLSMIMKSLEKEQYFCYGIFSGDKLCGYAYFVSLMISSCQYCLLDYYAIIDDMRGLGIGSEFLRSLQNELKDAEMVICESEAPDGTSGKELDTRKRRIAFYLRNHFIDTGVKASVFGVDYILLELDLGRKHTGDEIRNCYSMLYSSFLPEKLYSRYVRIG